MSLSKSIPLCKFCELEKGVYTCPRCNSKYCSSQCFKHRLHEQCSEMFFKEWVVTSLRNSCTENQDKQKMLQILQRSSEEENKADEPADLSMEERFDDLDLTDDIDEKLIWERLTEDEQQKFKTLLSDQETLGSIIPVKEPWWITSEVKLVNVISESSSACSQNHWTTNNFYQRPPLPVNVQSLSKLTTARPSNSVQYNIVNVLYCYSFLIRFYNNELRDFLEEIVDSIFYLSPVLSEGKNYGTVEEAIQDSLRLLMNSHFNLPLHFAKSLGRDICSIINGPTNTQANCYILCALNELKTVLLDYKRILAVNKKTDTYKSVKKMLLLSVKKIEYFISWSVDYYEKNLKDVVSKIEFVLLSEIVDDISSANPTNAVPVNVNPQPKKTLIEELD